MAAIDVTSGGLVFYGGFLLAVIGGALVYLSWREALDPAVPGHPGAVADAGAGLRADGLLPERLLLGPATQQDGALGGDVSRSAGRALPFTEHWHRRASLDVPPTTALQDAELPRLPGSDAAGPGPHRRRSAGPQRAPQAEAGTKAAARPSVRAHKDKLRRRRSTVWSGKR